MSYIKCLSVEAVLKMNGPCTPTALVELIQEDYYYFGIVNKSADVNQCVNGKNAFFHFS